MKNKFDFEGETYEVELLPDGKTRIITQDGRNITTKTMDRKGFYEAFMTASGG